MKDYPGSKGGAGVWQRIISEMPPHETYIEPFLGSGVVLRKKRSSNIAIGVDASSKVIQTFNAAAGVQDRHAICGDALSLVPFLVASFPKPALVYADPPYPLATRSCKRRYYEHEVFSADDHRKVLAMLKALPCMVMVSSYWSELYDSELAGWRTVQIPTVNHRGKRVIEWVWCNFSAPAELHDYRFVGGNFRERWRIEKMRRRWKAKLEKMTAVERRALLWAAQESHGGSSRAENGVAAGCNAECGDDHRRRAPEVALTAVRAENGASRGNLELSPDPVTNGENRTL